MLVCIIGSKNSIPQIPPHTNRGYRNAGVNLGAIFTPAAAVMPSSPAPQTARLLSSAPKTPAANTRLIFRAKLFIEMTSISHIKSKYTNHFCCYVQTGRQKVDNDECKIGKFF
jgi:hypothetical protein